MGSCNIPRYHSWMKQTQYHSGMIVPSVTDKHRIWLEDTNVVLSYNRRSYFFSAGILKELIIRFSHYATCITSRYARMCVFGYRNSFWNCSGDKNSKISFRKLGASEDWSKKAPERMSFFGLLMNISRSCHCLAFFTTDVILPNSLFLYRYQSSCSKIHSYKP